MHDTERSLSVITRIVSLFVKLMKDGLKPEQFLTYLEKSQSNRKKFIATVEQMFPPVLVHKPNLTDIRLFMQRFTRLVKDAERFNHPRMGDERSLVTMLHDLCNEHGTKFLIPESFPRINPAPHDRPMFFLATKLVTSELLCLSYGLDTVDTYTVQRLAEAEGLSVTTMRKRLSEELKHVSDTIHSWDAQRNGSKRSLHALADAGILSESAELLKTALKDKRYSFNYFFSFLPLSNAALSALAIHFPHKQSIDQLRLAKLEDIQNSPVLSAHVDEIVAVLAQYDVAIGDMHPSVYVPELAALDLSFDTYSAVASSGITSLEEITQHTEHSLMNILGLAPDTIDEIKETLHKYGLSLAQ